VPSRDHTDPALYHRDAVQPLVLFEQLAAVLESMSTPAGVLEIQQSILGNSAALHKDWRDI
jgi:hypothetical protein